MVSYTDTLKDNKKVTFLNTELPAEVWLGGSL